MASPRFRPVPASCRIRCPPWSGRKPRTRRGPCSPPSAACGMLRREGARRGGTLGTAPHQGHIRRSMALRLISPDGTQSFDLKEGVTLVVGRAPTCDVPVFDPTISRRHAEIVAEDRVLRVKDLGSSNGSFANGAKIDTASVAVDDLVAFGKVAFRLTSYELPKSDKAPAVAPAGATIVR